VNESDVPDWLLKAAQQVDAFIRQGMPIVRAAQQYVDEARAAQAAAGSSLLSGREVALAMDAGMRELIAAVRQQSPHRTDISFVGSVALAPFAVAGVAEVSVAADTATVTVRDDSPADVCMPLDVKTVFLAILWVFAILLPLKIGQLSPDVQAIIRDFVGTISLALIIHWRVQDSRKLD
jgi:hypothetical protein